jgi:phosphoglycolate phosphatase-like HAD superfamily hydrolase
VRRQIYLDCDGVLADFEKSAREILGASTAAFEREHGPAEFWKRLARADAFFENLDPMPDAFKLYDAVAHKRPIILTGMPQGYWAGPQKRRWAARYFPGVRVITTTAALKREHCHPGDVLVDDRPVHRRLWEAEGGIFVPHESARSSIAELRALGFI